MLDSENTKNKKALYNNLSLISYFSVQVGEKKLWGKKTVGKKYFKFFIGFV